MEKELLEKSVPALLRRLARQIEEGKNPSYAVCFVIDEDDLRSAFGIGEYHFSLIGHVYSCLNDIQAKTL